MVDKKIEPFEYQKSTNIDEHNQIVGKVNEIVDAINEVNLDEIAPEIADLDTRVDKNTTDISQLKISDAEHTEQIATIDSNIDNHAREITALKAKDATHDTEIAELDKVTDALTKEIPNGITLYRDGTGKIKAVISQEDDTTIDSNVLDMIIPYQYDIISGTTSRSFKLDITMSDGTKYTTNDFVIPAGGGTSVSITAITLTKNADNPNRFKVSVKLDDGSTIDSGEIEMVTSVSGTFASNKLTITVNGVSSTPITIDTTGTTYTAGTGIKIASGVISIDDTKVALKSDISDMETKTHANATFATKTALTTLQNSVGDAFSQVAVGSDGKSLDFTALDGQVNNVVLPSSGSSATWRSIAFSDFLAKNDWKIGDEFLFYGYWAIDGDYGHQCSFKGTYMASMDATQSSASIGDIGIVGNGSVTSKGTFDAVSNMSAYPVIGFSLLSNPSKLAIHYLQTVPVKADVPLHIPFETIEISASVYSTTALHIYVNF